MTRQRSRPIRLVGVLVIVSMLLAACSPQPAATLAPTSVAAPTIQTAKVDTSTFQLVQSGQLTLVTQDVQPPFTQVNAAGEREGLAIDIFDELGRRWGLHVTYTSLPLAALVPALSNAQFDAAAANLSTEGKPGLDFSEPVVWSYSSLVVLKTNPYQRIEDMTGKIVGAIQGSVQETQVKSYSNIEAASFANGSDMLAALRGGRIDAFVVGATTAEPLLKQNSDIQNTQEIPAAGQTGFPVPKGHDALLSAMNAEINTMMADGTFMKFYDKWFTTPPAPKILELYPVLAGQH